jgi:phosphoserine phosphatase
LKHNILREIRDTSFFNYSDFVSKINSKKRILPIGKEGFDITILATAAPSCYAEIIANNEGYDICLGTNFSTNSYNQNFENIKENKRDAVMQYLSEFNIEKIDVFVTDHIDDLPLMKQSINNIIVNPSKYLIQELERSKVSFTELKIE